MKNIIFGFILAVVLLVGITVSAKVTTISTWYIVDKIDSGIGRDYEKTYDENTGVACYSFAAYQGGGISCVKVK